MSCFTRRQDIPPHINGVGTVLAVVIQTNAVCNTAIRLNIACHVNSIGIVVVATIIIVRQRNASGTIISRPDIACDVNGIGIVGAKIIVKQINA